MGRMPGGPQPRGLLKLKYYAIGGALALLLFLSYSNYEGSEAESSELSDGDHQEDQGWAGSFLHAQADKKLNQRVEQDSRKHRYSSCVGDKLKLKDGKVLSASELSAYLDRGASANAKGEQQFVQVVALAVPCG